MLRFFKNLFGSNQKEAIPAEAPTKPKEEEEKKLLLKVEPHSSNMEYYCIYYKYGKFAPWVRITEAYTITDSLNLLSLDHPVMFAEFDTAVDYSKEHFCTIEKIREYEAEQQARYDKRWNEIKTKLDSRNKSVTIEM